MRHLAAMLTVAFPLLSACADEANLPLPLAPQPSYPTTVNYNTTVTQTTAPSPPAATRVPSVSAEIPHPTRTDASRVLILQTTHLDRPSEVVGVVDAHEEMGHHDDALRELQEKAAALGADAVVGVECHHGEGQGEPTHLSGLAVRFLVSAP
jgi:hypothetical protein